MSSFPFTAEAKLLHKITETFSLRLGTQSFEVLHNTLTDISESAMANSLASQTLYQPKRLVKLSSKLFCSGQQFVIGRAR